MTKLTGSSPSHWRARSFTKANTPLPLVRMAASPEGIMLNELRAQIMKVRCSLPLPVDRKKLLYSILPEVNSDEWEKDLRWRNIRRTMRFDHITLFELEDDKDEYLFWARYDAPVPRGATDEALLVPKSFAGYAELRGWADEAYALHGRMGEAITALGAFLGVARTPDAVRRAWPELAAFIPPIRNETLGVDAPQLMRRKIPPIQAGRRADIIDLLSQAALLPKREQREWVTHIVD